MDIGLVEHLGWSTPATHPRGAYETAGFTLLPIASLLPVTRLIDRGVEQFLERRYVANHVESPSRFAPSPGTRPTSDRRTKVLDGFRGAARAGSRNRRRCNRIRLIADVTGAARDPRRRRPSTCRSRRAAVRDPTTAPARPGEPTRGSSIHGCRRRRRSRTRSAMARRDRRRADRDDDQIRHLGPRVTYTWEPIRGPEAWRPCSLRIACGDARVRPCSVRDVHLLGFEARLHPKRAPCRSLCRPRQLQIARRRMARPSPESQLTTRTLASRFGTSRAT